MQKLKRNKAKANKKENEKRGKEKKMDEVDKELSERKKEIIRNHQARCPSCKKLGEKLPTISHNF